MDRKEFLLSKLGFRFGANGPHAARTMMLTDLATLLAAVSLDGSLSSYERAVVDENVLGKPTKKARELAFRHLATLYGLNPKLAVFRALRRLWSQSPTGQPLLALLVALARDPLLRSSRDLILAKEQGSLVTRTELEDWLAQGHPDRFSPSSLKSFAQNVNGTWTFAGYLDGHSMKTRRQTVQPGSWKPAVLDKLLADAECTGKGLEVWLREKFFEQHVKRFQHRPFIWHVWDGLKDGFSALVNYHKLDAKKLERLIHTYLGDWIRQQEAGVRDRIDGASQRLAAARDLKRRLELIQTGEPPYDIFVRWKSLAEQPVGWNPDLNDGVRLNIRPFMIAEVLRHNKKPKLNINWDKDRGKDVESAPWFKVFKGDRINDHHLTLAEKLASRKSKGVVHV